MRITQELLHKTARDAVSSRIKTEKDLIAAYLVGSVLTDEPLLGGSTDIDIVLVHSGDVPKSRELIRTSDELHLDLQHIPQTVFQQPRELRGEPWLGCSVQANPILLYDVRHWFEFTQASVGSQFYRADNTVCRARKLSSEARDTWLRMSEMKRPHVERVRLYFKSLYSAANSIAALVGPPITKRRFGLELQQAMDKAGEQKMFAGFSGLSQVDTFEKADLEDLMQYWEKAYLLSCQQERHSKDIELINKDYYLKSFRYLLDTYGPGAVAFPFLQTWTKAVCALMSTTPEYEVWLKTMMAIQLGKEDFEEKIKGLDAYLDQLEDVLDLWAAQNGA